LLTGYYEPVLKGSLTADATYRYPVWGIPSDWREGKAYSTRQHIDTHGLAGKAKPLLYVADKIDLFFLHIQGSGRVELPDGKIVKLSFAAKNNRPYTAIGQYLIARGEVPRSEMSVPRLKTWLRAHPQQAQQALWQNASYIFFKRGDDSTGAIGAQGVPLTPEASIAVDPHLLPYGVPVYLDTTLPYDSSTYNKLVVAQDTGSAIKGALRADLFFGLGDRAEHLAGGMKQAAKFFVLLPRS
jgi:membrane-bound lytic murein transglycosylase A